METVQQRVTPVSRVLKNLPDEIKTRAQERAFTRRRDSWGIGDDTNLVISAIKQRPDLYPDIGEMDVYRAMAIIHEQEFSVRTIRDYAYIAEFFTQDIRDHYDLLPYSHFRYAKSMGDEWANVLEYSLSYTMEHASPPSVEYMEMNFRGTDYAEQLNNDAEEVEETKPTYQRMPNEQTIKKVLGALRENLKGMNIPVDVKSNSLKLLSQLDENLANYGDIIITMPD